MTSYFVPTVYIYSEYDNTADYSVVGLFENEEDAMKALIRKLTEEVCINYEMFCDDHDDENDPYTQDQFNDMVYTKFNESKDNNKNINQNLHFFMNENNDDDINEYIASDFGQKWGCKIEVHSPFNAKPVMK
jgi:hypothetical protein